MWIKKSTTACTHTHTQSRRFTHRDGGQRTAGEEAHFPSPFTSSRVVGVLVGYSPEFTVKRKQWPRQNRSWHECTKNRRSDDCGTRSIGIQIGGDRSLRFSPPRFSNFRTRRGVPSIDNERTNERTKFNEDTKGRSTIVLFRIPLHDTIQRVFERNRGYRVLTKKRKKIEELSKSKRMDDKLVSRANK